MFAHIWFCGPLLILPSDCVSFLFFRARSVLLSVSFLHVPSMRCVMPWVQSPWFRFQSTMPFTLFRSPGFLLRFFLFIFTPRYLVVKGIYDATHLERRRWHFDSVYKSDKFAKWKTIGFGDNLQFGFPHKFLAKPLLHIEHLKCRAIEKLAFPFIFFSQLVSRYQFTIEIITAKWTTMRPVDRLLRMELGFYCSNLFAPPPPICHTPF